MTLAGPEGTTADNLHKQQEACPYETLNCLSAIIIKHNTEYGSAFPTGCHEPRGRQKASAANGAFPFATKTSNGGEKARKRLFCSVRVQSVFQVGKFFYVSHPYGSLERVSLWVSTLPKHLTSRTFKKIFLPGGFWTCSIDEVPSPRNHSDPA